MRNIFEEQAKDGATDRARALEIFAEIAASGSFSAAGRKLAMTPSGVSRAVDRLEARLGVRLLLRSTRALRLTAEGQAYLGAARRILADLDDAEQSIADQGIPHGRLRVSMALAHGRLHVVPLLGEFLQAWPRVVLDLGTTDSVVDVAAGQADVAIRFGPLPDSLLTARRVGTTRRVIVASPAYLARCGTPEEPEDLLRHNCLNFNFRRTEPSWPFRRGDRAFALAVHGNIEANNGETLGQCALAGLGIARVGAFSVAEEIADGRLMPLLERFNPGDVEVIHAVFIGGPNIPARVRVFVDFLAKRLA